MREGTFEQGFRDGWESIAGDKPLPENPSLPQEGEPRDYECGFRYGRSEASVRFTPGAPLPGFMLRDPL